MKYAIVLVAGALITLIFVIMKIRRSEIKTSDAIFWFFFVLCLLLLALFPQIAFVLSDVLGVESPANLVFLCIVAILLIKQFTTSVEMAKLRDRVTYLVQEIALLELTSDKSDKTGEQ